MTEFETAARLTEFAKEANDNAVQHGWWDGERDNRELIALIHDELSEALEEYRCGRDLVWYDEKKPGKPEGIAVELIDMVIRIADFMGHFGLKFGFCDKIAWLSCETDSAPVLIAKLHSILGGLMQEGDIDWATGEIQSEDQVADALTEMCCIAFDWLYPRGIDPWELLKEKHEYNKSRSYRHGNKLC